MNEPAEFFKEYCITELICNGIQVAGGAGLAYYSYKNGADEVVTYLLSAIAVGGTYNFCKTLRKNLTCIFMDRSWSAWDFSTGTLAYATGMYAFSESLKRNNKIWIPCFALAASGYYLTTSAIENLDSALNRRPVLKCFQLLFQPALAGCTSTYLFYFQKHPEKWLQCLPFLVTAVNGFNVGDRGSIRYAIRYDRKLLKGIEMFMGGSILCISSTALAIYCSKSEDNWPWSAFASLGSIYGAFLVYDSLPCFQMLVDMEPLVYYCVCGMIGGTTVYLSACISVKCSGNPLDPFTLPVFIVTAGFGLAILRTSLIHLHNSVPFSVFKRYCERVLGPIVVIHSSLFAAYVGYQMGWRFSLLMAPLVTVGAFATYNGFRSSDEPR